jgi:mannose-6-phosphate isomerase class I
VAPGPELEWRGAHGAFVRHECGRSVLAMTNIVPTANDFSLYNANPTYPFSIGTFGTSWRESVATLPSNTFVLAVDGTASLDWASVKAAILTELHALGVESFSLPTSRFFKNWGEITRLTDSPELPHDPNFATVSSVCLSDLLDITDVADEGRPLIIFGPGSSLFSHDVLWYVDLPKRFCEAALAHGDARNLGQPMDEGSATTKRQIFIDWPILDRHRDEIAPTIDRWIDMSDTRRPVSVEGDALRATLKNLASQPFRARPTFNIAPWGGHWGQDSLGQERQAENTAVGFQLLAPESGVVLRHDANTLEFPLSLMVALHPDEILGQEVTPTFGDSFPIRFNYLDTVRGDNLSIHCHPQADYMRTKFGWPYTQHESYYVVEGGEGGQIFLGLRSGADVDEFAAAAHAADDDSVPFDVEQFVQFFPSTRGQLFMIPAGTPHGSSKGNVVLEVSATPYLYSLRFYDWLRRDAAGRQRPVHVDHAFRNLNVARAGDAVHSELIQTPRAIRGDANGGEELLGALPECFFEVRRLYLEPRTVLRDDTAGRFHVLNVVEGEGVNVVTKRGFVHPLHRGETLLVPAACGPYEIVALGDITTRVVKALVA